jgi:hypothetical protein
MAATRSPGITVDTDGNYLIDELYHGARICVRLGQTTLEQAEARLKREVAHLDGTRAPSPFTPAVSRLRYPLPGPAP